MALKVKAVKRLLKFTKNENDPGAYRYVMKPEMYSSLPDGHHRKFSASCDICGKHFNGCLKLGRRPLQTRQK